MRAGKMLLALGLSAGLFMGTGLDAATVKSTAKKVAKGAEKVAKNTEKAVRKATSRTLDRIGKGPWGPLYDAPDNIVFVNVGGMASGYPTVGYERALGDDNSVTAQLGFWGYGVLGGSVTHFDVMGSYRWYLGTHSKMQGFFVGPYGHLSMWSFNYNYAGIRSSAGVTLFGGGAEGGYQWIFPPRFTVTAGLNLGYLVGNSGVSYITFGGPVANAMVMGGYAF